MKRRTFLRLSSAALASLSLSACGAKPAASSVITAVPSDIPSDSYTDIVDGDDDSFGMTFEEAQEYSGLYNCPYFIHRTNNLFYPIAITLESSPSHTTFLDYETLNNHSEALTLNRSEGDELVYLSASNPPSSSLSLHLVSDSGCTIPAILRSNVNDATSLCCLKYYNYTSRPSSSSDPNYAGNSSLLDHNYYFANFSRYDPINGPDHYALYDSNSHVTLNGSSISDTIQAFLGADNFIQTDSSTFNEYLICFAPHSPSEELTPSTFSESSFPKISKTVEWYEGTVYHSFTLNPYCTYFTFDPDDDISCPISLTPNGYAVVDLSVISSEPRSYILDCYRQVGDPHRAYLFIQP